MPKSLAPPIYGASRDGLVARFSTSFSGDNNIVVPLYGSFQGDPVHAKSLFIDNYNNGIPISFTIGGLTDYVPAYTSEFIDVSKMDTIILSATDTVAINLALYNTPQSGGRSRGIAPNGLSDPMWANVLGLWHFNANNGASIALDSRNPGSYLDRQGIALISTAQSQFGGSSAFNSGNGVINGAGQSLPGIPSPVTVDYTFEYSVYPVTPILVGNPANPVGINTIAYLSADTASFTGLIFAWESNGTNIRFSIYQLFYDGGSNFHLGLACATPYSYSLNTWYSIGITTAGGLTIYVNGAQAGGPNGSKLQLAGSIALFPAAFSTSPSPAQYSSGIIYVDEMRLTVGTRFTKNYQVSGQEFPNQ
jgi:hypothetical protein